MYQKPEGDKTSREQFQMGSDAQRLCYIAGRVETYKTRDKATKHLAMSCLGKLRAISPCLADVGWPPAQGVFWEGDDSIPQRSRLLQGCVLQLLPTRFINIPPADVCVYTIVTQLRNKVMTVYCNDLRLGTTVTFRHPNGTNNT